MEKNSILQKRLKVDMHTNRIQFHFEILHQERMQKRNEYTYSTTKLTSFKVVRPPNTLVLELKGTSEYMNLWTVVSIMRGPPDFFFF